MDFLNKAFAQLADLFRSMTPAARITTGLLLAVVVVSMVYLFDHQMSGPDAFLMGGEPIPASELQAMEGAFGKAGLTDFVVEGNRISVPRGKQAVYMAALADANAMPASFGSHLRKAVDGGNILTTSKSVQAERMKIALQDDLALVISSMRGIERASVLFNEQVDGGLSRKRVITAAVSVKPLGNQALEDDRVSAIRNLVAPVIGTTAENVTVVDLNSGQAYVSDAQGGSGATGDRYAEVKRRHEKEYVDKIREALAYIPGVIVTPDVQIDPEIEHNETETKIDPKAVVVQERENSKTMSEASASPGGRPGLANQGGVSNAPASVSSTAGSKSDTEMTEHESRSVPPSTVIQRRRAALTPTRVAVAVAIPSNYLVRVWQEKNPTPAGQEPKKPDANALATIETEVKQNVKDHVAQLIPPHDSQDPRTMVQVTTFPSLTADPLPQISTTDHVVDWFSQNWSTVGMSLLGLVGLVMLRGMVRAVPAPETGAAPSPDLLPTARPSVVVEETPEEEEPEEQAPARKKRRLKSGPSLRDDLVDMVHDDPDAAANVLRSWIGSPTTT